MIYISNFDLVVSTLSPLRGALPKGEPLHSLPSGGGGYFKELRKQLHLTSRSECAVDGAGLTANPKLVDCYQFILSHNF